NIIVDDSSNVYVAGGVESAGMATVFQTAYYGNTDGILIKFDPAGQLAWATYYGGDQTDEVWGLCVDSALNVYIAGQTDSPSHIATPGSHKAAFDNSDAFLAKFNKHGQRMWGTYFGGSVGSEIIQHLDYN